MCGRTSVPSVPTHTEPVRGIRSPTSERTASGGRSVPSYHHTSIVFSAVSGVPGNTQCTRALRLQLSRVGGGPKAVTEIGAARPIAR